MNEEVEALVLRQTDYKEADRIVTVLTPDLGKIAFRAAGVRKMTSRNASSLLLYTKTRIQFDYVPEKTIFRLKTARSLNLYRKIHEDLVLSASAGALAEAIDALMLSGDEDGNGNSVYTLYSSFLEALNTGHDPLTCVCVSMAELMDLHGMSPDVDECAVCGKSSVSSISTEEGGFVCADCAAKLGVPMMDKADLLRFRLLCKAGMKNLQIVEEHSKADLKDLRFLKEILIRHSGVKPASFEFLESVLTH